MSTTNRFRRLFIRHAAAACVFAASLALPSAARADEKGVQLLFTQQDAVQAFDIQSGQGYQIGTAVGLISGTSYVSFQFALRPAHQLAMFCRSHFTTK